MSYKIAGIDVHKKMLAVVLADVGEEGPYCFERRKFLTLPEQLRQLAQWLVEQEVEEAVMESTAEYWRPVWGMLEQHWQPARRQREGCGPKAGKLHLAQAQSNRGRRGRKNDFGDAERLVKRLVADELDLSFVPEAEQRLWRTITRRKTQITGLRMRLQSQLEGLLEQAHIKLSSLVSDLLGVSAQRILRAMAAGERDPEVLAALAEGTLKATPQQLCEALRPVRDWNPMFAKLLKMLLEDIGRFEAEIEELQRMAAQLMEGHQEAVRRLAEMPGLGAGSALQVIAEIGPRAAAFPHSQNLCSWVGVIPGQEESAEQNASTKSPKGNRQMRRILTEAAHAAIKTKGSIFEVKFNRFIRKMTYKEAIWAVAHFQCRLIWKILHDGVSYEERGPSVNAKRSRKRVQRLVCELKSFGFHIEPPCMPVTAGA